MDRQSILGFILIGAVIFGWMLFQAPPTPPPTPAGGAADTLRTIPRDTVRVEVPAVRDAASSDTLGRYFGHRAAGGEKILTVRTEQYTAELTTRGALVRTWELASYKTWNGFPVHLVDLEKGGDFSLLFNTSDGKQINTRSLVFECDRPAGTVLDLKGSDSVSVEYVLPVAEGKRIVKRYTFRNGEYGFRADIAFVNMQDVVSNFEYRILWENGTHYAEANSVDESGYAMAYASLAGEMAEVDAKPGEPAQLDMDGTTDWVATRNKYFAVAMIPERGRSQGVELSGVSLPQPDHGQREVYAIGLKMPLRGQADERSSVRVFLGPLDLEVVRSLDVGLDKIMSLGAAWIIRPIAEYVMMPLLKFLHMFIPNWGVVILVFSVLIKLALHPLTKTQMSSMRKMQALSPMMNEIREKYKDDPEKMNQQVLNLYKDYGVNPASGCLPLLMQLPILYALFVVFRSSIDLRQAPFVGWIQDLSIPDEIIHLPFAIPLFGIAAISGLALAMGITMFIQQKMTVTDPRQKAMVWMMPIMMTLMFTSLPSGLNLYYFTFNLLSIVQQYFVNRQHKDEPLRKVDPKKRSGGLMERLSRDLPKLKR
jgi:YidC/Oxa1 family membrane protein insertase